MDKLIIRLVNKIALDDGEMRLQLVNKTSPSDNTSTFYHEAMSEVDKHCIAREVEHNVSGCSMNDYSQLMVLAIEGSFLFQNPYYNLFAKIVSRTCAIQWVRTENIVSYIQTTCVGKRISGGVNWESLIASASPDR